MNEEHISLVCNHKHMLKKGTPPDEIEVRYCISPVEFYYCNNIMNF